MRATTLAVAGCLALLFAACGGSDKQASDETANTAPLPEDGAEEASSGEANQATTDPAAGDPAAGGAPAGEAGGAELSEEERHALDRTIELMTGFAEDLNAAGDDCDKIADTLNGFVDENKAELETLSETLEAAPDAKKRTMQAEMQQAMSGPEMQQAFRGMMGCQNHEGVKKGLEKMGTLQ